jgi:hypothetical protein
VDNPPLNTHKVLLGSVFHRYARNGGIQWNRVRAADLCRFQSSSCFKKEHHFEGDTMSNDSAIEFSIGNARIALSPHSDLLRVFVSGPLDETFRGALLRLPQAPFIAIDLENVTSINSCGVREWVSFIKGLSAQSKVSFEEVSIAFMDQMNITMEMLGQGHVTSLRAPYYCPHCQVEVRGRIVSQKHRGALLAKKAPLLIHEVCGQELEFDALEESFFSQAQRWLTGRT